MILVLTIIAVIGAIAVSLGKPLLANYLWIVSNPAMAVYNFRIGQPELSGMFVVYSVIALLGIINLSRK